MKKVPNLFNQRQIDLNRGIEDMSSAIAETERTIEECEQEITGEEALLEDANEYGDTKDVEEIKKIIAKEKELLQKLREQKSMMEGLMKKKSN